MAGGFKWKIDWDTNPLRRGGQEASNAIEDAADVFEDFARDADRATSDVGDGIADGIDDGTDTAAKALDRLERKMRDAADDGAKGFKDTGRDIGDNVRDGTDRAEEGLGEFRDEAGGTAREVAASFDGSADSIAGGFQELAANAFAGFGPAGAVAGLAAAAGIGIVWSKFQEDAEKAKARVNDMADAMIDAGSRVLAADFINDQLRMIYTNADDAAIKVDDLKTAVEQTGETESTLARAFAGDQDARVQALERLRAKYQQAVQDEQSLDNEVAASGSKRVVALEGWMGQLERLGGDYTSAAARAAAYGTAVEAGQGKADRAIGQTKAEYDALSKRIDTVPDANIKTSASGIPQTDAAINSTARERAAVIRTQSDTSGAERDLNRLVSKTWTVQVKTAVQNMKVV